MKRFRLNRIVDVSGISGTGYVAEGLIFSSGKCVVNFTGTNNKVVSITVYDKLQDVVDIHCHNGSTILEWID